jgi:MYXO-CTERM domain-containing protein
MVDVGDDVAADVEDDPADDADADPEDGRLGGGGCTCSMSSGAGRSAAVPLFLLVVGLALVRVLRRERAS